MVRPVPQRLLQRTWNWKNSLVPGALPAGTGLTRRLAPCHVMSVKKTTPRYLAHARTLHEHPESGIAVVSI